MGKRREKLIAARKRLNLSQDRLAKKIEDLYDYRITGSHICKIELGHTDPSAKLLRILTDVLDLQMEDIISEEVLDK